MNQNFNKKRVINRAEKYPLSGLCQAGAVAALYVVLTLVSAAFGLSGGAVQLRLSEALTVLPAFFPSAVPGLFAGCLLANLLTGCALPDVIFGSLATLAGALGTRALRKHKVLCLLPPVLSNTLAVPPLLAAVYGVETALPLLFLSVFAGEAISCGVFGGLLFRWLDRHRELFSRSKRGE